MPIEVPAVETVHPPLGAVSLDCKRLPVCERLYPECPTQWKGHAAEPLCVTRATLDVSAFKAKLLSLPADQWDDEHQEGNVKITRPAHDAWGIKKIAFTFCDDFLLKVVDLPWSRDPQWAALLLPVYQSVGITDPDRQVVRSLLASMPPQMAIPVHHDTGYWVKHTHRCHLPLVTNGDVHFLAGPAAECMQRVIFAEGAVVELNNQAKHSVVNANPRPEPEGSGDDQGAVSVGCGGRGFWRVHLIFDYVDLPPSEAACGDSDSGNDSPHGFVKNPTRFTRLQLHPGDRIVQTRRTVDVVRGKGQGQGQGALPPPPPPSAGGKVLPVAPLPRFMVIGAQKCGTTSLYEYISQHPLVVRGQRREAHYFDWRYNTSLGQMAATNASKHAASASPSAAQLESAYHRQFYLSSYFPVPHLTYCDADCSEDGEQQQAAVPSVASTGRFLVTGDSTPSYLLHSDVVLPRLISMYSTAPAAAKAAVTPIPGASFVPVVPEGSEGGYLRLLVMLRCPVARAVSQFAMMLDQTGTAEQRAARTGRGLSPYEAALKAGTATGVHGGGFERCVELDMRALEPLRDATARANEAAEAGDAEALQAAEAEAEALFRTQLAAVASQQHGAHSLLLRGLYGHQLRAWTRHFPLVGQTDSDIDAGNPLGQVLVLTLDQISATAASSESAGSMAGRHHVQRTMDAVFRFVGLRPHDLEDTAAKNQRRYTTTVAGSEGTGAGAGAGMGSSGAAAAKPPTVVVSDETRARLAAFYRPFNAMLLRVLRGRESELGEADEEGHAWLRREVRRSVERWGV